ncbi:hypothetical protein lerEdw1_016166 [Lerista edwardsae]|nr:hypothetical protein lerEdw1_016166 [Lerista edwardsae]
METDVEKKISPGKKQKCSLVKDVPWGNSDTNSNYAIMKNTSNSNLASSAKLIFGGKKTNAVLYYPMQSTKNPMLDNDIDSSPNAALSVPVRRGRPQKLKFSEIGQHLKNIRRSVRTSQQVPLETDFTCSEVVFDIEDVDGVFFASFPSKLCFSSLADFQVRLHLLETKLLEDLKYFRHRQVIHPSLQEVGLKLGSVDPGRSIDLKYLGVHLPLNLSKDYEFGASSTGSQDIISKGSLKNQSAFYSDKLDEYLENEGKLIETSLELPTSASDSSVVCQLPSKNTSCIETNQVLLHKTSSITPPSSYTFKPFSMPSVFRKMKRKTKNRKTKRKRATSRGRAKSFNKLAVPSSVLSKEKYAFPDDKISKLQSELGENVWERQRTEQQTQQSTHVRNLSKEKLMDLVLEYCMLRNRKQPTHVTEEHGKPSLATHFVSQEYDIELPEKPCGPVSNIGGSNADIPSPGMSVNLVKSEGCSHSPSVYPVAKLTSQILGSQTKLPIPDTQAATIFPPELISMSQALDWFPKVCPAGLRLAQMAGSEPNLTYCSSQQLNSPTSLSPLQSGSFALHQLPKQQIAHHTFQHIASLQAASNLVSVNHTEGLGTIMPEEGKLSHLQKVVVVKSEVPESDTMPEESELMVNTTDNFEALTDMVRHGKSMVATATPLQQTYALDLSSEALCMYPYIPSAVPLSDHSYVSRKLNSEMFEKKQHAWYFEDALDKVSEVSWQTKYLESNMFLESLPYQKEAAQLKSLGVGQAISTQTQRPGFDLEGPEQPQIRSKSFPTRWEVQDNFELLVKHKNERDGPLKLEGDREDKRREAKATCAKDQNCATGMEYVYSAQECLYKMNTGFQKNCNASSYNEIIAGIQGEKQTVKDNLAPGGRFWSKIPNRSVAMRLEEKSSKTTHCKNGFMPITDVIMDDNKMDDSAKELISRICSYRIENVETLVKDPDQKAELIALGTDEKTSPLHEAEAMLLEVPMTCSESEKIEQKFHSGAVPCIRDAATLEMDEKNAETMEKLSSDAPIFYPEGVLSDHTYVTKVKAEKEQHMIFPEDIPDSISLLVSPVDHTE